VATRSKKSPSARDEALAALGGKLGHTGANPAQPFFAHAQRQQVGFGEISIIVRVFLRPHAGRLACRGIVQARLLHHRAAALNQLHLPRNFIVQRHLREAE
jgi:hypothetical protein